MHALAILRGVLLAHAVGAIGSALVIGPVLRALPVTALYGLIAAVPAFLLAMTVAWTAARRGWTMLWWHAPAIGMAAGAFAGSGTGSPHAATALAVAAGISAAMVWLGAFGLRGRVPFGPRTQERIADEPS